MSNGDWRPNATILRTWLRRLGADFMAGYRAGVTRGEGAAVRAAVRFRAWWVRTSGRATGGAR
jgi:hypothetical protein